MVIKSFSHLESCNVENKVEIGPYARIRPDTILKEGSKKKGKDGNMWIVKKIKDGSLRWSKFKTKDNCLYNFILFYYISSNLLGKIWMAGF